jgi:hypothetical protein
MQPGTDQYGQPIQQAAPQPQYGQPPQQLIIGQPQAAQPVVGMGMPGMGVPATSATVALVLSILGLVMCSVCTAVPGLIIANQALAITNQYPGHPDAGTAKAAMVISWVVIGLAIAGILFYAILFAGLAASGEF